MTRAERLRAAAAAERLADWVEVTRDGILCSVYGQLWNGTLAVYRLGDYVPETSDDDCWLVDWDDAPLTDGDPTRDAAIRAGLIALAEREERA